MKKGLIIGALVLLVAAGVLVSVLTNLNTIVKAAIERYGSQATRTAVNVSSVTIELASGRGALTGLSVANPSGFISKNIFLLKQVSVKIAVKSLSGGPIVIDQVRVEGPQVFFDMNGSGATNIEVLKKNLESSELVPAGRPSRQQEKEARLVIRKFVFESGKVHVNVPHPYEKTTVNLPRLELTNIGGSGGVTAAQAAKIIATALAEEAATAALRAQGEKALKKGTERLLKRYRAK
jgi:uncharacterized protein involved in outer membrane biogenesis